MAARGRFIPKNPQKYIGNPNDIWFRSSWEVVAMKRFDLNPAVLKWGSEEIAIPYLKPVIDEMGKPSLRPAKYFPDFIVIYRHKDGNIVKSVMEVKPLKESVDSKANNPYDKLTLAVNKAKWAAAAAFCERNGLKFEVITERSLFYRAEKPAKAAKKPTGTRKPRGTRK